MSSEVDAEQGELPSAAPTGPLPIPTGVAMLDDVLAGGIPPATIVLIIGPTGSLRSTLAYQIAEQGARSQGTRSVFLSLDQDPTQLRQELQSSGYDIDAVEGRVHFIGSRILRDRLGASNEWLTELLSLLRREVEDNDPDLIVIDSLTTLLLLQGDSSEREMRDFLVEVSELKLTVVFTVLERVHSATTLATMYAGGLLVTDLKQRLTLRKMRGRTALVQDFHLQLGPGRISSKRTT